jgi:MT0933-like antitoxin protein
MSDLISDAEKLADTHPKQTDEGLDKAAKEAEMHTGDKFDKEINSGVDAAEKHLCDGTPSK